MDALRSKGGVMSEPDLAAHRTSIEEAISAPSGHTIHQMPPNGRASSRCSRCASSTACRCCPTGRQTQCVAHRIAEALRLAFADGVSVVGDYRKREVGADTDAPARPDRHPARRHPARSARAMARLPTRQLPRRRRAAHKKARRGRDQGIGRRRGGRQRGLRSPHTAQRVGLVTDGIAMDEAVAGGAVAAFGSSSETTYLTAVDGEGNACSFICSNYCAFGS